MCSRLVPHFKKRYSTTAGEATLLLLFVMFFLPYMITFEGAGGRITNNLTSFMWRLVFYTDGRISLRLEPHMLDLPHIFLKYLFAYLFYRYYKGFTTEKQVLIVGVLSELQSFFMLSFYYVLEALLGARDWISVYWLIPIPITLVVSILLMKLAPRPGSEPMWIEEEEEKKSWWRPKGDREDTSQEPYPRTFHNKMSMILTNLKGHPIRSMIIIGLFIVYLPFVYQIHLNLVAAKVSLIAGMYFWRHTGCSLFPIPIDYTWFGILAYTALIQLAPLDAFVYRYFYPSSFARIMWSVLWLTFGILYLISPLLKSKEKKVKNGAGGGI